MKRCSCLPTRTQGAALRPAPRRALSIATLGERLSGEGQLCFKRPHFFPGASLACSSASTKRFPMTNISPEPKIEPRHHTRGDPERTTCSPPPLGLPLQLPVPPNKLPDSKHKPLPAANKPPPAFVLFFKRPVQHNQLSRYKSQVLENKMLRRLG